MSAALDFLERLHPDGPSTLAVYKPRPEGATLANGHAADWVSARDGISDIYVLVGLPEGSPTTTPTKEKMRGSEWLWCDVDPRPREDLDGERERIRLLLTEGLPANVPPPTLVVDSGRGMWALWQLDEPCLDPERVEDCNLWLANQLTADKCHNINRVMRLAGTVNLKTGQRSGVLLDVPGRLYSIDQFPRAELAGSPRPPSVGGGAGGGEVADPAIRVADLAELDRWGVSDRTKVIIARGEHPDVPKIGDSSRSGWLWEVCCRLVDDGVPDQIILGIITDPGWAISESVVELGRGAERYARRQVERARLRIESQPPLLNRDDPMGSAREFVARKRPTLMHYNDDWLAHDGAAYRDLEDASIRAELYKFLDDALTPGPKDSPPVPFRPTKAKVANVEDALRAVAHRPRDIYAPPCWLEGSGPPPGELLACQNGLLHLPTGQLLPPTEHFFTRNALQFAYQPEAPAPERWLSFLEELWGDGPETAMLQDVMGYLLTPDTSQQKVFLVVGPRRSGKGTIGRVLRELVGSHNTVGPTLGSLAGDFGLEPLIGKQLAIVSDMRLGAKTDKASVAEHLLRISGEDVVTAGRKYKSAWTGQLSIRFLIMTNQLPRFDDDSGALANRMVPILMRQSFLGREDNSLTERLLRELPGILNWAIEGWRRLQARGQFVLAESSEEAIDEVHRLGSPVASFMAERLVLDPQASTPQDEVWAAWRTYCEQHGLQAGVANQFASKILAAGHGRVATTRPRSGDGRRPRHFAGLRIRGEGQSEIPF